MACPLSSLSLAECLRFGEDPTMSERRGLLFDVGLLVTSECLPVCLGDWGSIWLSGQGSKVHWNLPRNLFIKTTLNYCDFLTKIYFGKLYTVN